MNSLNSSSKKDDIYIERSSKEEIFKETIFIDNNLKTIKTNLEEEENKNKNNKKEGKKEEKKEIKTENNIKEKPRNVESIFQRIRKEFPINDDKNINKDYIKEKEKDKDQMEEENYGLPQKVRAPHKLWP